MRTRTLLYAAIIALVGAVMTFTLATRRNDGISIIHDRNPLFVRLSDGAVRNGYAIRILNRAVEPQSYTLKVSGLPEAAIEVIGTTGNPRANRLSTSVPIKRARCASW